MSDLLLLELPAQRADPVRWLRWDSVAGQAKDRGELAAEEGLMSLAANHSDAACYAIVPGEAVSWHEVVLPKAGRVGLSALPFQLEDRLCSDLDGVHIAHAPIKANQPTDVLIVERALMQGWFQQIRDSGLRIRGMLPDYAVIPENVVLLDELRATAHLEKGAAAVQSANFPVWWQLAGKPEAQFYCADTLRGSDALGDYQPTDFFNDRLAMLAQCFQPWSCSLLTGEFALQDKQRQAVKRLRWPAALAATLLVVLVANFILATVDMNRRAEALDQAMDDLYRQTFPGSRVVNARSQMRSQLNALSQGGSESQFLPWLDRIATASRGRDSVTLLQLSFESDPAVIKLSVKGDSYDAVEQWVAALSGQGFDVNRGAFGQQDGGGVSGQVTLRGEAQ